MTNREKDILRVARSMLRDLVHDWSVKELAGDPRKVCESLSNILGEKFDFDTGEVIDG